MLGSLWIAQDPRQITVPLDTCTMHNFICAWLAATRGLRPLGQPRPTLVLTAASGQTMGLATPVLHLMLGDTQRESMVRVHVMDGDANLILGSD